MIFYINFLYLNILKISFFLKILYKNNKIIMFALTNNSPIK